MKKFIIGCILMLGILAVAVNTSGSKYADRKETEVHEADVSEAVTEVVLIKHEFPSGINVGFFRPPIDSKYIEYVTSEQGFRDPIYDKGRKLTSGKYHNAIDWYMPVGSNVYAAKDGEVTEVRLDKDVYGLVVTIRHPDRTETLYAHLSSSCVKVGDHVNMGDLIALSGGQKGARNSGVSTGPHLHFEIILDINEMLMTVIE